MPLKTGFHPYSLREKEACHAIQGNMRKHHVWPGGRSRSKGKARLRAFIAFLVGKTRKARGNSFGLDSLHNIRGSGVISSDPVPSSGVIQDQVRESGKGFGHMVSGALGLHTKDMFLSEFCMTWGISKPQGKQSLPASRPPKMSKYHKIKKHDERSIFLPHSNF